MHQKALFEPLKSKNAIRRLFRSNSRIFRDNILWKFLPGPASAPMAVVWAIPRQTGSAVRRNRLRRIGRASLYDAWLCYQTTDLQKLPAYHVAISLRPGFEQQAHPERVDVMRSMLEELYGKVSTGL